MVSKNFLLAPLLCLLLLTGAPNLVVFPHLFRGDCPLLQKKSLAWCVARLCAWRGIRWLVRLGTHPRRGIPRRDCIESGEMASTPPQSGSGREENGSFLSFARAEPGWFGKQTRSPGPGSQTRGTLATFLPWKVARPRAEPPHPARRRNLPKRKPRHLTGSGRRGLFLALMLKMCFQDLVDITGQGTVVVFRQFFDFIQNRTIQSNADFFFQWFHISHPI